MSDTRDVFPIELHMFSSQKDVSLVELLFATAYYHKTTYKLQLNHTVNFGRSWQDGSLCTYGLISLPYLDGPALEILLVGEKRVKFYWLIPITESELRYKQSNGIEALEEQFDKKSFDYINPERIAVV